MNMNVKIGGLPEMAELERQWVELESRSHGGFFVSWAWIGVWLANLPIGWPLRLIRAEKYGKTVGMGILARGVSKKILNLPYCTTEYLHETGVKEIDMVIEHNDFLLDAFYEGEARLSMIEHWLGANDRVVELCVPGCSNAAWRSDAIDPTRHGMKRFDMMIKSHLMDLDDVRRFNGDPVALLEGRTRSKIRRAIREYSKYGELRIEQSSSVMESLDWLNSMEKLHQKRWVSKGEAGCFSNPLFVRFHRMMIERNYELGCIKFMRINVGQSTLGYLYGFSDAQRFYLYQCGFDYEFIERKSMPGLVSHVLAMRFLAYKGLKYYDYLGGSSRYKSALSNVEEDMTWTTFRSNAARLRAIDHCRPMINKIRLHKTRLIFTCKMLFERHTPPFAGASPMNQSV